MKKNNKYLISTILLTIVICFVILEVGLRLFSPFEFSVKGFDISLPKNKKIVITPKNSNEPPIIKQWNSLGFRGEEWPLLKRFKIITVGGSTTACSAFGEGETWPDRLAQYLKPKIPSIWVNNAGFSGHSTFGHIKMMQQYIAHLKPEVVLFLVGVNDNGLAHYNNYEEGYNYKMTSLNSDLLNKLSVFLSNFEIYNHILNFKRYLDAKNAGLTYQHESGSRPGTWDLTNNELVDEYPSDNFIKSYLESYRPFLEEYAQRIRQLSEVSKSVGIIPVFITQPALIGCYIDQETGVDVSKIKTAWGASCVHWKILSLYNKKLIDTAQQLNVKVIDLAKKLPKQAKYYSDLIHYSYEGNKKVAEIISEELYTYLRQTKAL